MQDVKIMEKLPEIKTTNQSLIDRAQMLAMSIEDEGSFKEAGLFLVEIDRRSKWWEDLVSPAVESAFKAHKAICMVREEIAGPLKQSKKMVGNAMATWDFQQKQKAAEEARKQAAILRKQQEDAALAQAQQLQDSGHKELADAVMDQPIHTPVFSPPTPKADGIGFRSTWSAEVLDFNALVIAVAAGKVPLAALKVDPVFLNRQASSLKNELRYPGVRVSENRVAAVRS